MDNAIGVRQQLRISCRNIHRFNHQLFFRAKSGQRGKLLTLDKSAFAYRGGTANNPEHLRFVRGYGKPQAGTTQSLMAIGLTSQLKARSLVWIFPEQRFRAKNP